MELQAAIAALRALREPCEVEMFTAFIHFALIVEALR
jgi:ribonuclease HI